MSTTAFKKARAAHQPTGCWIKPDKRLAVYLRDGMECLRCGKDLSSPDSRTLDHVVTRSEGGSNMEDNIFTSCWACNCSRQAKPLREVVTPATMTKIKQHLQMDLSPFKIRAKLLRSQN